MKKYKFILTLPYGEEIDSAEAIEGHHVTGNYSHAETMILDGVFDTYEEAKTAAEGFKVYKYIAHLEPFFGRYDSYEDQDEEGDYYLSFVEAESAACDYYGISDEYPIEAPHAEVRLIGHDREYNPEYDRGDEGERVFHYVIVFNDNVLEDSRESGLTFDNYDDAIEAGDKAADRYDDIASIEEIEIKKIEIVEFDDEEAA